MSVRLRRLKAESEELISLFTDHERIRIVEATGNPPDRYVIEYRVRGLVEEKGEIKEQHLHRAQITLGPNYPRERPRCVMLTPVFHPNIDHLAICTEDIGAAGQTLDQTVVFIGEMIAYQAFNLQSPRNGDAARWTAEHLDELPLEGTDLVPHVLTQGSAPAERPFVAPYWTQPEPSLEPPATPVETAGTPAINTPVVDTQPVDAAPSGAAFKFCANCGQSLASNSTQPSCAAGHSVCEDCLLTCQNCRQTLCVLCETQQCANCLALFCADCVIACEGCHALACLTHIQQCQQCRRWQCLGACVRFCGVCGAPCCQEHLNAAHRCVKCAGAGMGVALAADVPAPLPPGTE